MQIILIKIVCTSKTYITAKEVEIRTRIVKPFGTTKTRPQTQILCCLRTVGIKHFCLRFFLVNALDFQSKNQFRSVCILLIYITGWSPVVTVLKSLIAMAVLCA